MKDSNNRRIPTGEYLKLEKKGLLLYTYLQQISSWTEGENHRYIEMDNLNKADMSKKTGISRPSVYNQLEYLESKGMIKYWTKREEGRGDIKYLLLPEIGDYYVLINLELKFIKALLELCDEVLLRVFLFHKSYSTSRGKQYTVTLDYIAENIGYSKTHLDKIIRANEVLVGFEIIKQNKTWVKDLSLKDKSTKARIGYTYLK